MPTVVEKRRKEISEAFGLCVLTQDAESHGMSYSQFMGALKKNNIELNRKFLQTLQ